MPRLWRGEHSMLTASSLYFDCRLPHLRIFFSHVKGQTVARMPLPVVVSFFPLHLFLSRSYCHPSNVRRHRYHALLPEEHYPSLSPLPVVARTVTMWMILFKPELYRWTPGRRALWAATLSKSFTRVCLCY